MKIEALETLIVATLRTELTALESAVGQTAEWIYVDFPRKDAKMPRISVTLTSSPETPAAIGGSVGETGGTLGIWEVTTIDVDIWVHRTNKVTGPPKRAGTRLRDYIADEIVDVFLQKRGEWCRDYDISDVEKLNEYPHAFDPDTELFRKTISFRITHLRVYEG